MNKAIKGIPYLVLVGKRSFEVNRQTAGIIAHIPTIPTPSFVQFLAFPILSLLRRLLSVAV
jgi:hypothetical protein